MEFRMCDCAAATLAVGMRWGLQDTKPKLRKGSMISVSNEYHQQLINTIIDSH